MSVHSPFTNQHATRSYQFARGHAPHSSANTSAITIVSADDYHIQLRPRAPILHDNMSTRKLRSDTAAERAAAAPSKSTVGEQPAKKQKSAAPKYICTCCGDEKTSRSFPNYTPTPDCDHLINTCRTCLKQWVEVQVDSANFLRVSGDNETSTFGIKCVECKEVMRPVNVEIAASKAVYEKFDKVAKRKLAEDIPGWRWCLAPLCDNGQKHVKVEAATASKKKLGRGKKKDTEGGANLHACSADHSS